MAQVDPSIAMGFRPVQIPQPIDPLNQLRARAEIENAFQQQQLNALKMQEYKQDVQERNELAKLLSGQNVDLSSPEFMRQVLTRAPRQAKTVLELAGAQENIAKRKVEEQKLAAETAQKNRDQIKASAQELASYTNADDALRAIDRNVSAGVLTEVQGAALKAEVPTDPAGFSAWQKQKLTSYLTVEQQLSRTEPKPERVDIGGSIVILDMNPNSATYGQEVGPKSITKTPATATDPELVKEYKYATDPARGKDRFTGSLLQFKEAVARAGRTPAQGDNPNKVAHTSTDDQGNVTFYNAFGQVIRTQTNAGKRSPSLIKAEQAEKNLGRDIERTTKELAEITKEGGLIDQSTGSYAGKAVDIAARTIGMATKGDIASAKLKPIADMVLKMVPRFEGPQSDKDTQSYKEAAGQLSDSTLPPKLRKEAGLTILRLMKERKNQFAGEGMDMSPEQRRAAPVAPQSDVRSRADAILGQ